MSISLPVESESVRCVDFARLNNVDPGGTGLSPDVLALVEVPEPWPKPVGKHADLVELVAAVFDRKENIRLLAAIPTDGEPRAIVFRPTATGMTRAEVPLGDDALAALNSALDVDGELVETQTGRRSVLVCTQGSHDVCCGVDGAQFADVLEARSDIELFRVSHTGGHRFSPTAMTLPDGRMWAYLTPDMIDGIVERNSDRLNPTNCRGWWGAPTGRAQVAERAVFGELGFAFDEAERSVEVGVHGDLDLVQVTAGESSWLVRVERGREVPSISCEAPGGRPVKPGREWDVISIEAVRG